MAGVGINRLICIRNTDIILKSGNFNLYIQN